MIFIFNFTRSAVFLALLFVASVASVAQSSDYLKAPVVRSGKLVLLVTPAAKSINAPNVQWMEKHNGTPQPIARSAYFLTAHSLRVVIKNYDPLSMGYTFSQKDIDDPAIDAITSLMSTVGSVVNKLPIPINPSEWAHTTSKCHNSDLETVNDQARKALHGLPEEYNGWKAAIDNELNHGTTAMQNGVAAIKKSQAKLHDFRQQLQDRLAEQPHEPPCDNTEVDARINASALIQSLQDAETAMQALIKVLEPLIDTKLWDDRDFIVGVPTPTYFKEKAVSVSIYSITMEDTESHTNGNEGNEFRYVLVHSPATNLSFTAQHYWHVYPTAGAGIVFSSVSTPNYVAVPQSTGQAVVMFDKNTTTHVSETVTLNLVPHVSWKGQVAPFVQLGGSKADSLPALLLGGGVRVWTIGKGDLGIGGGLMLAWYKDLGKLKVGDTVLGQPDVDRDMSYQTRPKTAPYLSVQYKF